MKKFLTVAGLILVLSLSACGTDEPLRQEPEEASVDEPPYYQDPMQKNGVTFLVERQKEVQESFLSAGWEFGTGKVRRDDADGKCALVSVWNGLRDHPGDLEWGRGSDPESFVLFCQAINEDVDPLKFVPVYSSAASTDVKDGPRLVEKALQDQQKKVKQK